MTYPRRTVLVASVLVVFPVATLVSQIIGKPQNTGEVARQELPTWTNKGPVCSGIERWPTAMAFAHMKNAGIVVNSEIDFGETRTIRLASERIGENLWRQVHHVTFTKKSGETIEAITVNDASIEECSMGGVEVFVISRHLGTR